MPNIIAYRRVLRGFLGEVVYMCRQKEILNTNFVDFLFMRKLGLIWR